MPSPCRQAFSIAILRVRAGAFSSLARVTVGTPSLNRALMQLRSILAGIWICGWKSNVATLAQLFVGDAEHDVGDADLDNPYAGQERLGFQFNGLGEQPPRTGARRIGQGIIDIVRLTKADNVDRLVHGVALSVKVLAGIMRRELADVV
jgi:hypothetical protein